MRIAMIGTRGVPARYGGFETCVEEVGRRLADRGHDVVVYCRGSRGPTHHLGMRLVHLPAVRARALETPSHTALAVGHLLPRGADAVLLFNAANAPLLPLLRARGLPVATHVDGLEWRRAKWSGWGRRYYRVAESLAVRWSDALVADARGIADYYRAEFGALTHLVAYGAPVVPQQHDLLRTVGLSTGAYHLVVARMEPENHVDTVVAGHARSSSTLPLVVVGTAPYGAAYEARVRAAARGDVRFLGGVWDQRLLDQLYSGALTYQHGHSVGGTNPSLLRAVGAGAATCAYDVVFNREVLAEHGRYWRSPADVADLLEEAENDPEATLLRGKRGVERARAYDWDEVASSYEALCERLARGDVPATRPSGHRSGLGAEVVPS